MTMTKKRLISLTVALAACICLIAVISLMMLSRPGVTRTNFGRIENGMTHTEVSDIFGGKPPAEIQGRLKWYCAVWRSESGATAEITFQSEWNRKENVLSEGRVVSKEWIWIDIENFAFWRH
jgi:hypothetical protein